MEEPDVEFLAGDAGEPGTAGPVAGLFGFRRGGVAAAPITAGRPGRANTYPSSLPGFVESRRDENPPESPHRRTAGRDLAGLRRSEAPFSRPGGRVAARCASLTLLLVVAPGRLAADRGNVAEVTSAGGVSSFVNLTSTGQRGPTF